MGHCMTRFCRPQNTLFELGLVLPPATPPTFFCRLPVCHYELGMKRPGGRRQMAWLPGEEVNYLAKEALPNPHMPSASGLQRRFPIRPTLATQKWFPSPCPRGLGWHPFLSAWRKCLSPSHQEGDKQDPPSPGPGPQRRKDTALMSPNGTELEPGPQVYLAEWPRTSPLTYHMGHSEGTFLQGLLCTEPGS